MQTLFIKCVTDTKLHARQTVYQSGLEKYICVINPLCSIIIYCVQIAQPGNWIPICRRLCCLRGFWGTSPAYSSDTVIRGRSNCIDFDMFSRSLCLEFMFTATFFTALHALVKNDAKKHCYVSIFRKNDGQEEMLHWRNMCEILGHNHWWNCF